MSNKIIINAISAALALSITGTCSTVLAAQPQQNNTSGQDMMQGPTIPGMERCFGIAKAGMNDCGNASHHCSGEAKIDRDKNEWLLIPAGLYSRIAGGSTKSSPEK
jgi:uncharacterized membrane protein